MCYSAQIWADYRKFTKLFGAIIDIGEFVDLYWLRSQGGKAKLPKAMDAPFADPQTDDERRIKTLIDEWHAGQVTRLEKELFTQKSRLVGAERTLQTKPTKKAAEDKRIATNKIELAIGRIADLQRSELIERDSRIFPGGYAPVMVMENGKRVVKPMRYQCRPAGKPAFYDSKYPGTYNARRDSLEGFWRELFGCRHGIMVASVFWENVARHAMEHRELTPGEKVENVVLEFRPSPPQEMLVACLWSEWHQQGQPNLLSFAAITDDPPAEVAAAGHDRFVIAIKPENIDAWLTPHPGNLPALYAILDDRARPHYEYRMAA